MFFYILFWLAIKDDFDLMWMNWIDIFFFSSDQLFESFLISPLTNLQLTPTDDSRFSCSRDSTFDIFSRTNTTRYFSSLSTEALRTIDSDTSFNIQQSDIIRMENETARTFYVFNETISEKERKTVIFLAVVLDIFLFLRCITSLVIGSARISRALSVEKSEHCQRLAPRKSEPMRKIVHMLSKKKWYESVKLTGSDVETPIVRSSCTQESLLSLKNFLLEANPVPVSRPAFTDKRNHRESFASCLLFRCLLRLKLHDNRHTNFSPNFKFPKCQYQFYIKTEYSSREGQMLKLIMILAIVTVAFVSAIWSDKVLQPDVVLSLIRLPELSSLWLQICGDPKRDVMRCSEQNNGCGFSESSVFHFRTHLSHLHIIMNLLVANGK